VQVQVLNAWARELVLIVALAAVLEMALPRGDFRRFSRLVMGLLVLLAMLKPLLGYMQVAVALPGGELRATRSQGTGYVFSGDAALFPSADAAHRAQLSNHVARLVSASLEIDVSAVSVDVELSTGTGWPGPPRRLRVRVTRAPERLVAAWMEQTSQTGSGGDTGGSGAIDGAAARAAALASIGEALRAQLAGLYRLEPGAVEVSMPR
jgi:stage III sporulation protein AF